jgi:glutaredoxin
LTIVTLYTRPGCHLCDEAREALARIGGFELREVDIDSDEALLRAYVERIPVVEVDGRVVSELVFDADAFARAIDAVHTVGPWRTEP